MDVPLFEHEKPHSKVPSSVALKVCEVGLTAAPRRHVSGSRP
jgi:hypothetical protein